MITAVDTNVLIDVLGANAKFGPRSAAALRRSRAEGAVVACDAVWAETAAWFADASQLTAAMSTLRVEYRSLEERSAAQAGRSWRTYRKSGGDRGRLVTDFLVAGHALCQADRLLTRDRGFYRRYFDGLELVDPSE